MKIKNSHTGETAPAHRIGETEDGKAIYQSVEGWVLTTNDGIPVAFDFDHDGNMIENTEAE